MEKITGVDSGSFQKGPSHGDLEDEVPQKLKQIVKL